MAAAVRESFFPAIKCSMCNADVEISQMGDHICAGESEELDSRDFPLFQGKQSAKGAQAQKLAGLPRIDPAAANRTFHGRDQLTPSSSTTGSARSPPTPRDGQPLRTPSHNSPSLLPHPQSRAYRGGEDRKGSSASIYNIDSPFPPFKSPTVSPMSPHALPRNNGDNEFYPTQPPVSPGINSRSVMSRMNNIAPGPFGVNNNSSRDRQHDALPTAAINFPERGTSKAAEPYPAASFPVREEERRQRRDQIERDSRDEYAASRWEGSDRDRGREQGHDVPRRMPTPGSDYSSRTMRSQSPGSQPSRQPPKERNAPPVPSLGFGQRGGKIRTEEPRSPPHGSQSRYSDTGPDNPKFVGLRPEARSNTFPVNYQPSPAGKAPPHPGVGLPRSPSVTVGHKKNKSSTNLLKVLPTPPLPSIPDMPITDKRSPNQRRQPSLGANKLGEDMLKGAPLPGRGISPPRPKSPPVETRPPVRKLSPPNPNEYSDFSIGNPYEVETPVEPIHATSPSMSSNASSIFSHRSERSSASATSSPPTPDVNLALKSSGPKYDRERRTPSNASKTNSNGFSDIDGLMKELQSSMHDLAPTPSQERLEEWSPKIPREHSRPPSHERQGPLPPPPAPLKRQPPPPGVYQEPPAPINRQPAPHAVYYEPPAPVNRQPLPSGVYHEPPIPVNRQPPPPGVYQEPPPPRPAPPVPQPRPLQYQEKPNIQRARTPPLPPPQQTGELFMPPQPQMQFQQQQERPVRRAVTSKGNCRGCGEGIIGKSISSADGRLTGRYHKTCFVCQDCRMPFQSAEFYVLNNLPYCERHYHTLNHSLCPTCDRGIEGPCLETEWHERFHPSCFSCSECACALGGDYFELNGRPYCERHAYQMMQGAHLGPNRMANMERRRTRMMFM